jgi:uncharacterized membrane protein YphA (DoxX/SURF4 family)
MKRGFSAFELEFLLLGSSMALFLTGAGVFSVDALLSARRENKLMTRPV